MSQQQAPPSISSSTVRKAEKAIRRIISDDGATALSVFDRGELVAYLGEQIAKMVAVDWAEVARLEGQIDTHQTAMERRKSEKEGLERAIIVSEEEITRLWDEAKATYGDRRE